MASVDKGIYLPPLEACLNGSRIILSWKLVATALADISGERQKSPAVVEFLSDSLVKTLLSVPATVFEPPNAATKASYETRTAPANAPASVDGRYDINQIKAHATWLSEQAKINMVAALRVVVVELQARPSSYLLGPLSSQDIANVREAAELGSGQDFAMLSALGTVGAGDASALWTQFESEDAVKLRIFDTYLSERRHLMATAEYVHAIASYRRLPIVLSAGDADSDLTGPYAMASRPGVEETLKTYIKAFENAMENIEAGVETVAKDKLLQAEPSALEWTRTALVEVVHSLSVVFQWLDIHRKEFAPSSLVGEWFSLMEVYAFLDKLEPINEQIAELILPIKTLTCAISLLLLRPLSSLLYLDGDRDDTSSIDNAYLAEPDVLESIHSSIINAANLDCECAAPVIFAWTLIIHRMHVHLNDRLEKRDNLLHQSARETFEGSMAPHSRPKTERRNSVGSIMSIETLKFDGFLQSSGLDKDTQLIEQLGKIATGSGRVFDVITTMAQAAAGLHESSLAPLLGHGLRHVFLDFLKACYPVIGYQSDPVSCLVSVLTTSHRLADRSPIHSFSIQHDVTDIALQDELLLQLYFQQSLDRFPYEFLPFIQLCRALCSGSASLPDDRTGWIVSLLGRTPSLTFALPASFQSFEMPPEEENTNAFILTEDLILIPQPQSRASSPGSDEFRIPSGTVGRFVSDTGRVVLMHHEHSGLALLGRRLELSLDAEPAPLWLEPLSPEETAEVIGLIADLVRMEYAKMSESGGGPATVMDPERDVLTEASRYMGGAKDIISVVCDIMDHHLHDGHASEDDASIGVLAQCVQFLNAVLPQSPTRVWSYMARCDLLNSDAHVGKLGKLVGELDLIQERYEFMLATIRLWSSMVETAMVSAVQRRCGAQFASRQRSGDTVNPWLGVADRVLDRVCHAMVQATVDVFENTATWRFTSEYHRIVLVSALVPVLDKTVVYAYGMEDEQDGTKRLTDCLRTAAAYTVDAFLSPSAGSLRAQAMLGAIASSYNCALAGSTVLPNLHRAVAKQLDAVARFAQTLLRMAVLHNLPSSVFENRLFKASTLIARLIGVPYTFKRSALDLLEALVSTAGKAEAEPPSLLGHLGTQTSKSFLQTLARLDSPFDSPAEQVASWKLCTAIVGNRQQWMANYLLTGKTPRDGVRKEVGKSDELSADSVLAAAFKKLAKLSDLDSREALATLEFVTTACNHSPRTIMLVQKEKDFVDGLQAFLGSLRQPSATAKTDVVRASVEARLAAYVAQIFAMQLHHLRQLNKDKGKARALLIINEADYYLRDAAYVSGYKKSLHTNFAKNFAERYAGCTLESFKRTAVAGPDSRQDVGTAFYYDIERANAMLQFDPSWVGRRDNGFKLEMELANANLALVDAQVVSSRAVRE